MPFMRQVEMKKLTFKTLCRFMEDLDVSDPFPKDGFFRLICEPDTKLTPEMKKAGMKLENWVVPQQGKARKLS